MFRDIPEMFRGDFAETEEEALRWVARSSPASGHRPPAARIAHPRRRRPGHPPRGHRGPGSPHGGVFLDVASQRTPEEIIRKLPGMYHQFKELADVDITKDPMEVGPTCHYMMGGVRVDPETQESTVPGLFAAGEVSGGMHGANRLGGNSLSDLLVFGKRAGEFAAKHARGMGSFPSIDQDEVEAFAREALAPFDPVEGENPYTIHEDLRTMMQPGSGSSDPKTTSSLHSKSCRGSGRGPRR